MIAVTVKTRYECVMLRECSELLYGRFPPKQKGVVYDSYVRLAILHGSEA